MCDFPCKEQMDKSKGKQALKDLRTVQRRKDTIKNIYLDPINKKIIMFPISGATIKSAGSVIASARKMDLSPVC